MAVIGRGPLGGNGQIVPSNCGYPDPPPTVNGTQVTLPVGGRVTSVALIARVASGASA